MEDPLAEAVTIERSEQVEAAAGDVVARIGAAAERLKARYALVDAFTDAVATREDTRAGASIGIPVVLAVSGRTREARERARSSPGDFAERLDR